MIERYCPNARVGAAALALLALTAASSAAQEPMVTDRPAFTQSTATVMPGVYQIEAGYTFTRFGRTDLHQLGEALLRTGLIEGLELRFGLPSFQSASREDPGGVDESGIGDAHLGMKLGLFESGVAEGLPSLALLLGTGVPVGDDFFGADGWEPEAKLALDWSFTESLGLGANVNYAQRDPDIGDRYDEWAASVAVDFPLTQSLSGFGEYFAIRPDVGGDRDYLDAGVTWLMSRDLQLDARIGVGIDSPVDDDFFIGVGFAKRF